MNLLALFSKPKHTEVAELRDRCIVAETRALLLADELERARRPKRERRRDAASFIAAKKATTEALARVAAKQRGARMQGRVG